MEKIRICQSDIQFSAEKAVDLLIKNNKTVTFAESCTGGLCAKKITDVSGASQCFECSFVTYSNAKKSKLLGVLEETLNLYGAVSFNTAFEMCKGAKKAADSDIGIGITGIAGPGGGTPEKPVGLVFVGFCAKDIHTVFRLFVSGNRDKVRDKTSDFAIDLICKYLSGTLKEYDCLKYEIEI